MKMLGHRLYAPDQLLKPIRFYVHNPIRALVDDRTCTPPNPCQIQWVWDGDQQYTNCIEVDIYPENTQALRAYTFE